VRLKSFEARGFKSFADKVSVNFENGITAIVGPNGSGKSNISDAIRWVMGEQSVKYLRGTKMEDVIFSGSSARKPMGMADVTLVFDNTDHSLPMDFDEISIRRRVYRSGESEYFINGKNCRLKDIVTLLADTGLGRGSMSIIGQNKIDEILNSRPEERRSIFEETAGIAKFRMRKKEALRKLDDTANNLLRIHDIRSEIYGQLQPLEKAAEKARKYRELDESFKSVKMTQLVRRIEGLEKEQEAISARLAQWQDEESALAAKVEQAVTEKENFEASLNAYNQKFDSYQESVRKRREALTNLHGQQSVFEERVAQGEKQLAQTAKMKERLESQLAQQKENLNLLTEAYDKQESQFKVMEEAVKKTEAEKNAMDAAVKSEEKQIQEHRSHAFERMQNLVNLRNELRSAEEEQEHLHQRLEKMKQDANEADEEKAGIEGSLQQKEAELTSLKGRQEDVTRQGTALKDTLTTLAEKGQKEREAYAQLSRAHEQKKTRYSVLSHMEQEHEGFSRGVKTVLSAKAGWRSRICGVTAELITVQNKYITAIETALGGALQNIITLDADAAKSAIRYLKEKQGGRATFLPLDTLRQRYLSAKEKEALKMPGIIGTAAELVQSDETVRPAITFLLGQVLVADNLDHAFEAARRADMRVRVVTLDGDVIYPGGSLSGGQKQQSKSFLSRRQEISALEGEIKASSLELSKRQESLTALEKEQKEKSQERDDCVKKYQELAVSMATVSQQLEQLKKEAAQAQEKVDLISGERAELAKKFMEMNQKVLALAPQVKTMEAQEEKGNQEVLKQEEALNKHRNRLDVLNRQYQNDVISFNSIKTQLDSLSDRIAETDKQGEKTESDMAAQDAQTEEIKAMIAKAKADQSGLAGKIEDLTKELSGTDKETQAMLDKKEEMQKTRQELEHKAAVLAEKQHSLNERKHTIEMDKVRKASESEAVAEQLTETYHMTADEVREHGLAEGSLQELKKQEILLGQKIEELGPVNLAAEEDYTAAKDRYEFLTKQYDDMVAAKEQLETVISGINSDMTKRFREAFNQINKYFGECYEKLFGGGKARLVITNEQNLLEAGIEIEAQPPGKKMRNLSLFSGGERALTVIALLFALLTYQPAPFVILDEIDAPLDEANIDRFAEFLREYGKKTQFIIITHRKGTMEAADVMHGVTMSEAGVSRILSVKLSEVAS
jgi:chromosome segregation protein